MAEKKVEVECVRFSGRRVVVLQRLQLGPYCTRSKRNQPAVLAVPQQFVERRCENHPPFGTRFKTNDNQTGCLNLKSCLNSLDLLEANRGDSWRTWSDAESPYRIVYDRSAESYSDIEPSKRAL